MRRSLLACCPLCALLGCAETYCQSGPKYGTVCYDFNEIEWQETQIKGEPPPLEIPSSQPAPGFGPTAGAPSVGSRPPAYLMSGACSSLRQPANAAIR